MTNYIYNENNLMHRFDEIVDKYKGKKVLLYGASLFLERLLCLYDFSKMNIVGIADKKFSKGHTYNNFKTFNFNDIKKIDCDVVLITIFNSLNKVEQIFDKEKINYESFLSEKFIKDVEIANEQEFLKILEYYKQQSMIFWDKMPSNIKLAAYDNSYISTECLFSNIVLEKYNPKHNYDVYFIWGLKYFDKNYVLAKAAFDNKKPLYVLESGFVSSIDTWANDTSVLKDYLNIVSFTLSNGIHYFDSIKQNSLEYMFNDKSLVLTKEQLSRARSCIDFIINNKLSKYNCQPDFEICIGRKGVPKVLVVDQSFGDASIKQGGADDSTFSKMLNCAIKENLNADIIVKTHPDTRTGTRKGYYTGMQDYDNVYFLTEAINPITLLNYVDKVYVCTSQFGFEALMCGKEVHTFGTPFYSGWGLTVDCNNCERRTNNRTVEELFYITYILYTRYVNPISLKVCEIEEALKFILELRTEYFKKGHLQDKSCLFCGGKSKYLYNLNNRTVFQCLNCHTSFVGNMPNARELKNFYSGFLFCVDETNKDKIVSKRFKRWFKSFNLKPNALMLDVGGGGGYFSNAFEQFSLGKAVYIDLDEQACDYAKKLNISSIINDSVENIEKYTNDKFDIIYCRHVIEHLVSPVAMIDKCLDLLSKDGIFILQFPNGLSFEYLSNSKYKLNKLTMLKEFNPELTDKQVNKILYSKKIAFALDPIRHLWAISSKGIIEYLNSKKNIVYNIETYTDYDDIYSPYCKSKNIKEMILKNIYSIPNGKCQLVVKIRKK